MPGRRARFPAWSRASTRSGSSPPIWRPRAASTRCSASPWASRRRATITSKRRSPPGIRLMWDSVELMQADRPGLAAPDRSSPRARLPLRLGDGGRRDLRCGRAAGFTSTERPVGRVLGPALRAGPRSRRQRRPPVRPARRLTQPTRPSAAASCEAMSHPALKWPSGSPRRPVATASARHTAPG